MKVAPRSARTPNSTEVGFNHEVTGSPAALPVGMRPEATPPNTAASRNGVTTDALARLLFQDFVLPFEVVSVLLLAAVIGGVFLAADVRRFGDVDLQRYFERRAATSAGVLLVTALVGLLVLHEDAPTLLDGLQQGWGLLFAVVATVGVVVTGVLEHLGRIKGTRLTAIVAVASLVLAWGFAQNPYLLPKTLTVAQGAGDPDTLRWLVIVAIVTVVLVGPALALLYRLDLTDRLTPDLDEDLTQAQASRGD